MKEHKAQLNYLRIAPRKVRVVADTVRGLAVNEAEAQLMLQRRRPAQPILKLIRSAVSGAKEKGMHENNLFVHRISVNEGPMLKRILPRAFGSATEIQKKSSHVTVVLAEKEIAGAPRFTMVTPKRVKAPKQEKEKTPSAEEEQEKHKHAHEEEHGHGGRGKGKGIFKRVFSPRSRAAK